jgi:hypothetical protein
VDPFVLYFVTLFGLVFAAVAADLVWRWERAHPVLFLPVGLGILGLWGFSIQAWFGYLPTELGPHDAGLHASIVSWALVVLVLGLCAVRGIAPAPRGVAGPPLTRPSAVGAAGAMVALGAVWSGSGLLHNAHLVSLAVPWRLAFGRTPGTPRVDSGRRLTAGLLVLAWAGRLGADFVVRGESRQPLDGADVVTLGVLAAVVGVLGFAGRPKPVGLLVGLLLVVMPVLTMRFVSLPFAPVEVPRLVGLDGQPVQLRPDVCVEHSPTLTSCEGSLFDVFHPYQGCQLVVRGTDRQLVGVTEPDDPTGEWCSLAATADAPLRSFSATLLDDILVENGRYALSGSSGDQTVLVEQVTGGARLSVLHEPVAMDDLAATLRRVGRQAGFRNDVRVWGPDWTLQQAVSICVTAYDAGFLNCTFVGGAQTPLASGQMLLSPFEFEHPDVQLADDDPRGAP